MKETNKLLAIYLLIIAVIIGTACNPVKRVLADIDKVKEVRTATDALFPCLNDTTIYSTDTLIEVKELEGTVKIDTAIINDTVYLTKTVTIDRTKTVYRDKIVRDTREEKRLNDDLNTAINRLIISEQQRIKDKEEADEYRQDKNMWMWIAIGLMVAAGIGVVLKLKKVF